MQDIKLDNLTHDVLISDYDISLLSGIDRVVQNIKIRLLFFYAEWYLNTTIGVTYYEDVLVKTPDIGKIESIIIDTILTTNNVYELLEFDSSFDNASRVFRITFKVSTGFGTSESITQELSI